MAKAPSKTINIVTQKGPRTDLPAPAMKVVSKGPEKAQKGPIHYRGE